METTANLITSKVNNADVTLCEAYAALLVLCETCVIVGSNTIWLWEFLGMSGRFFSEICTELASSADQKGFGLLASLLRMAALEAAASGARHSDQHGPQDLLVGAWDWDVVHDRVYADARFAQMFGITAAAAAEGTPLSLWIDAVHPEDKEFLKNEIRRALAGELFSAEYRVITEGKTRWLYARGKCTLDQAGRPIRFPGAIVEITHEKDGNLVSIVPQVGR